MIITWYGAACFKIQSGDLTIITDPFSKENAGLTPPRFRADIVTLSHHHSHLQSASIPEQPVIIDGPGEYEIKGAMFYGLQTYHDAAGGAERGFNTAYGIDIEQMRLVHLGFFGEEKLRGETLEELGTVDILFVPVGGADTIDGETAKKIVQEIEPRIVIPMGYDAPGTKESKQGIDAFLKEMGARHISAEDHLTIKKKNLPQAEETKVVVLKRA